MITTGTGDAASSALGWISIACWVVVYTPQLFENYSLQSGEGVSVAFIAAWLLADFFNLVGALLAGLIPTIIVVALYYSACDSILLTQIYYYRWKRVQLSRREGQPASRDDEHAPLLAGDARRQERAEPTPIRVVLLRYSCAVVFVVSVGLGAWWLSDRPTEDGALEGPETRDSWLVQFCGWTSALLFLGARFPQIWKNFKTRCEGLSPALFFFSILGNTTYALSIVAKSTDKAYLLTNAGWLAGSALTVFLDIFVLCQFIYFRTTQEDSRIGA